MNGRDDEPSKQEVRRPGIAAPASVPRPSRPPPPATGSAPPRALQQSNPAPRPDGAGSRKGTLDGVHPGPLSGPPVARAQGTYGFMEPTEDDFDAEKTMVVDPDDAPTADYDPLAHGNVAQPGTPPATDLTRPVIPAAPQAPTFDPSGMPAAKASEMGKRRTSRRTVKLSEDRPADADGVAASPSSEGGEPATVPKPPRPADPSAGLAGPDLLTDELSSIEASDLDPNDEITIVKALRIISIGSDPPPPITSAIATWPPRLAQDSSREEAIEEGWTPAAPAVALKPTMSDAPAIAVDSEGEEEAELTERISEPGAEQEILEEIEPDATPFSAPAASPQPKRPPPPPPKTRGDTGPQQPGAAAAAPAKEARPVETSTEAPPKAKPWYEDIFSDEYLRTHDRLDERACGREVDFIEESLGMEKHAVVLDLACGMGDHACELAGRGYSVVGVDLSKGMLRIADQKVRHKTKVQPAYTPPNFVHGDMRELPYEEAFDGAYSWGTSFGYFDDEKNLLVLQKVHRALRQGGMFLIDMINRDYVTSRSPSLVWFEGQQCVCMDDVYVDYFTSRLRVKRTAMFEGGLSRELDYSIRLYTLHELGLMLHQVGFKVIEVTGHPAHPGVFFGTESPRLIVLAERS